MLRIRKLSVKRKLTAARNWSRASASFATQIVRTNLSTSATLVG
jgi:hypothetical protein